MSERAEEIDIVSASYDRGFEYRKLHIAFDAIWFHKRTRLVTTNPDPYCPLPGAGARKHPHVRLSSAVRLQHERNRELPSHRGSRGEFPIT